MRQYLDSERRLLHAGRGIGERYMTMRGNHRVKSGALPVRDTFGEAQADLDRYATAHGFELYERGDPDEAFCRVCGCTEDDPCPGGCSWVPDPEMLGDLCSRCLEEGL